MDIVSSTGFQDKNIVTEKPKSVKQFYIILPVDRKSLESVFLRGNRKC